jgi:RNA polymerase sigma-70 factor (ECF subfamily)
MSIKASEDKEVRKMQVGQESPGDPDLELVRRTKGGDSKAYEELVIRHQRRAFNVAYRILGDYDEALDITQDAFIQAYRSVAGFREESRFSYWLLTIAVNLCRNRLRQWKRRARNRTASIDEPIRCEDSEVRMEIPDPSPSALDNVTARQTERLIREEMMFLEEEFRTVLVLRELQEMSYEEIGDILGIAAGTVKSRLHRGRSELRDRLRKRLSPTAGAQGAETSGKKEEERR